VILSIVVMAYNECASLDDTVRGLHAAVGALAIPAELLIVDDGSTDGTGELARQLAAELAGVRVTTHPANAGLGAVYRTGFREARGDFLTFFPADGQFPATILADMVLRMPRIDLLLGLIDPAARRPVSRVLSAGERLLYRCILGPLPRFQGVCLIRRALLERHPLLSEGRGWGVLIELIARASRAGCRVEHLHTPLRPRAHGRSKVNNWRTIGANLRQALGLRAVLRRQGAAPTAVALPVGGEHPYHSQAGRMAASRRPAHRNGARPVGGP
jgi:glycosyltransferase involved in cell wall biosynthesis